MSTRLLPSMPIFPGMPYPLVERAANANFGPGNYMFDASGRMWVAHDAHQNILIKTTQTLNHQREIELFGDPIVKRAYYQSLFNNPEARGFYRSPLPDNSGWSVYTGPGGGFIYKNDGSVSRETVVPGMPPEPILGPGSITVNAVYA